MKKKKKKVKKIVDLDASDEPDETAKSEDPSVNEETNKENEAVLPVQESQDKDTSEYINPFSVKSYGVGHSKIMSGAFIG